MKAGYGFTDPGYSFYHWEAKAFDPGPEISRKLVQDFSEALLSTCDTATLVSLSEAESPYNACVIPYGHAPGK